MATTTKRKTKAVSNQEEEQIPGCPEPKSPRHKQRAVATRFARNDGQMIVRGDSRKAAQRSAIRLYPYQERWVRDQARFKLAVKATQIGYSFAAALEAVLDCLEHRTLWIVLSRGERQSDEFMQKVRQHTEALRIVGSKLNTSFFEEAEIRQHEVTFPNGSRIIGLPANPDTARGYTGNMILDEFAFHHQDREIWAAAFGRISRGDHKLRVISTPNGQRGKYYELAKVAGLVGAPDRELVKSRSLVANAPRDDSKGLEMAGGNRSSEQSGNASGRNACATWSGHWCDVHSAVKQGCPMDVETLRRAMGDAERWHQEYECVFLSASDQYIPLDLITECEHPQASVSLPPDFELRTDERECYFGYDVARVHDLAVVAVVEKVGDVFWTRALIEMPAMKFSDQEKILSDVIPLCRRGCIDATGLGGEMAERLAAKFPGRVEPVSFTAGRKQEMAVRMKRHCEERTLRIPDHRALRRDLTAVKRIITTAGNIRFDAERTEESHADRFWALALALQAEERGAWVSAASGGVESEREWYIGTGFGTRDSGFEGQRREELAWA